MAPVTAGFTGSQSGWPGPGREAALGRPGRAAEGAGAADGFAEHVCVGVVRDERFGSYPRRRLAVAAVRRIRRARLRRGLSAERGAHIPAPRLGPGGAIAAQPV